jgi:UDP:flavonoid glycosyltransferase YjiC (YdhE family)
MFPEWFGPPQSDWPPQIRLTGFPMFEDRQQTGLPAEVLNFCRTGAPPIVFTFGTGMMHARDLFRHGIEACERLGARAIFLTKYTHQLPEALPRFALHHHFVPFQELFPHCAAVVHHGGIGTTARALAAGIPQLILPFAFDQMDNATRVKQLGTGAWLKSKHIDGARITEALTRLMSSETHTSCRLIAARFEKNDAIDRAADLVEGLFGAPCDIRPQH